MLCPRCISDTASKIASAPDGSGAWEFYYCSKCNFGWRSTEEPEVIDPNLRDPWFQLDDEALAKIPVFIPVQKPEA